MNSLIPTSLDADHLRHAVLREACRRSLMTFVRMFWRCVEPRADFVEGWWLEALTQHLEAVTDGKIKRLIVNVPPGSMKSLMTNVFWPAWEWGPMERPSTRYVAASYSSGLTERDNVRMSQIVLSPLYQELWGDLVKATENKIKFSNTATGWKLATSTTGVGTGERGDRVICLPFDALVLTSNGWLQIGVIVHGHLPVRIAGWSGSAVEWQEVEAYEINPAGQLVEIDYGSGVLRCTGDHPVWVDGRGYVAAGRVQAGDCLRVVHQAVCSQAVGSGEAPFLLSRMQGQGRYQPGADGEQQAVLDLREAGLSAAVASGADARRGVLQPQVSRRDYVGCSEPDFRRRPGEDDMPALWRVISAQTRRGASSERAHLFGAVRDAVEVGGERVPDQGKAEADRLRGMCYEVPATQLYQDLLLAAVQKSRARQEDDRRGEQQLSAWRGPEAVPTRLEPRLQKDHPNQGQRRLPPLRDDAEGARQAPLRAPCGLQQEQPGRDQPDYALPVVPRSDARQAEVACRVASATVRAVRSVVEHPDRTYNLRVAPHHNYFADGVLVHNCDDPNNIQNVESDDIRNTTNRWLREVMPTRVNSITDSAIVVIQQRSHEDDATGVLLASEATDWCHLMVPMRYEPQRHCKTEIGWQDPRTVEGELMWPERFPAEEVDRLEKELGPYATASQHQQLPNPRGGGIIKVEDWQLWPPQDNGSGEGWQTLLDDRGNPVADDNGDLKRVMVFPDWLYLLIALDTAYTEKEQNDWSACTVWGIFEDRAKNAKIMLVEAWRDRLELHALVRRVVETCRRRKADLLLIEDKAAGYSVSQEVRRLMRDGEWSVRLWNGKRSDKVSRLMACEPLFAGGLVYAPTRRWARSVIDEVAAVPRGKHDDLADTTSMALLYLRQIGLAKLATEGDPTLVEDELSFAKRLQEDRAITESYGL